jgi:hypothetical protein
LGRTALNGSPSIDTRAGLRLRHQAPGEVRHTWAGRSPLVIRPVLAWYVARSIRQTGSRLNPGSAGVTAGSKSVG